MQDRRSTRSEIDGIPLLVIERDGPVEAALIFRVGRGDDDIVHLGLSHLVEHLAGYGVGEKEYEYNARVSNLTTVFTCRGTIDEATDFLSSVAGSLQDLSEDRLALELRVLAIETGNSGLPDINSSVVARFGTTGIGAAAYPDFGASTITFAEVEAFRQKYFTRQNAVVVMTQTPPASFGLNLPEGERQSPPGVVLTPRSYPAAIVSFDSVGLSMLGQRSETFTAGLQILERRLLDHMRNENALSYTVGSDYARLDAEQAIGWVSADIEESSAQEAWNNFTQEVQRFAFDGPTQEEIDWQQRSRERSYDDDATIFSQLISEGEDLLLGTPLIAETPTRESVHEVMQTAMDAALYEVPFMLGPPPGLPEARFSSAPVVEGRRYEKRYPKFRRNYWVVSEAGISEVNGEATDTILWDDVVLVQEYSDSSILILDRSGLPIAVEPDLLRGRTGFDMVTSIQACVPHDRFVYVDVGPVDPYADKVLNRGQQLARFLAGPIHKRLGGGQVLGLWATLMASVVVFLVFGNTESIAGYPNLGYVIFFVSVPIYAATALLATVQSRLAFLTAIPAVVSMGLVGFLDRDWNAAAAPAELLFAAMTAVGVFATWLMQPRAPRLYPRVSRAINRPLLSGAEEREADSKSSSTVFAFQIDHVDTSPIPTRWQVVLGAVGPRALPTWQRATIPMLWMLGFVCLAGFTEETEPIYPFLLDVSFVLLVVAMLLSIVLCILASPWGIYAGLLAGLVGLTLGLYDRTYDPPTAWTEIYVFGAAVLVSLVFWPRRRTRSDLSASGGKVEG